MIEEVKLPEISENVESGQVISVIAKVGDFIEKEQSILELETDKAAFEVPSTLQGRVAEITVKEGDTVNVGQTIAKIDTAAKPGEAPPPPKKEEVPPPPKKDEESQTWLAPGPVPGVEKSEPAAKPVSPQVYPGGSKPAPAPSAGPVNAAPAVRQLARELGIDIHKVPPGAPDGHISADDVKNYASSLITGALAAAAPSQEVHLLPDFSVFGEVERKPITLTRKSIAAQLGYSWPLVPQVTHHDRADITDLEEFRAEYGSKVEKAGGKLTVTSILIRVIADALKQFPHFNASYDSTTQELILKKYYHVAVAVDTDRGLLVPVMRDVDKKDILQLSVEVTKLAEKTRDKKVTPDDMQGGNFTISNLGGIGGVGFTPIVYWPQLAILGVSRACKQPFYKDNLCYPRLLLPLSLSYDHRVIDGAQAARFTRYVAEALEKPFLLAMQEKK
jgi:pyruvate dehydrogenase E2 component (dihydrolipoamide acetyltransferase)